MSIALHYNYPVGSNETEEQEEEKLQLCIKSEVLPRANKILQQVRNGIRNTSFRFLSFEEMPDTVMDNRELRHALFDLAVSREWDSVAFKRCDDPDFQHLIERCLLMNRARSMDFDVHFGINFSPEKLGLALRNGLQYTRSLRKLVLGAIRLTEDAAASIADGLAQCQSLHAMEVIATIFETEQVVAHLGRGIEHNGSIHRLTLDGIDECLPILVDCIGRRACPLDELHILSESCNSLNSAMEELGAVISNGRVIEMLDLCSRPTQQTKHGTDKLAIAPLARALRGEGHKLQALSITCQRCEPNDQKLLHRALAYRTSSLQHLGLVVRDRSCSVQADFVSFLPSLHLKSLNLGLWRVMHCDEVGGWIRAMSDNYELKSVICRPVYIGHMCDEGIRLSFRVMTQRYCRLNRSGRHLFRAGDTIPASLWPVVLGRINRLHFSDPDFDEDHCKADLIYEFLCNAIPLVL